MNVTKHSLTVTTDGSGDATAYTDALNGKLINIIYTKDDYATDVDLAITAEGSGLTLWEEDNVNASKTVSPRQATHDKDGTEQDTSGDVKLGSIYLAGERIKVVVDNGGDTKSGTFEFIVAGPTG